MISEVRVGNILVTRVRQELKMITIEIHEHLRDDMPMIVETLKELGTLHRPFSELSFDKDKLHVPKDSIVLLDLMTFFTRCVTDLDRHDASLRDIWTRLAQRCHEEMMKLPLTDIDT